VSNELVVVKEVSADNNVVAGYDQFLMVRVGAQLFGIPVTNIRDVLKPIRITHIPLSKPEIIGFMNLRGRIVTVIDMRKRLATEGADEAPKKMFVVVENEHELYSLQVDEVGDSKTLPRASFENNPENMPEQWKTISKGIFKLDKELMLVLDVANVIKF
jgi:purine-binding chemotaxis protein CheW